MRVLSAPFLLGRRPAPAYAHAHQGTAVCVPIVQAPVHAQAQHGPAHSQEARRLSRPVSRRAEVQEPVAPAGAPPPVVGRRHLRRLHRPQQPRRHRAHRHAARDPRQHRHRPGAADQVARGCGQDAGHQQRRLDAAPRSVTRLTYTYRLTNCRVINVACRRRCVQHYYYNNITQ